MVRLLLVLCALCVSVPASAAVITIDVIGYQFTETGLPTACINCADADPNNDFMAALSFSAFIPVPNAPFAISWSGFVDFTGSTLTDPDSIDLHILVDLLVTVDGVQSAASLFGELFGIENNLLIANCCFGMAGPVPIQPAPIFPFPFPTQGAILAFEVHPPQITAVPEPATMLLVGSGLLAGWQRRRRRTGSNG